MPIVHNRTQFCFAELQNLPVLKVVINNWRQRNIKLCQHPVDYHKVISVGETFDGSAIIVCEELKTFWQRELSSPKDTVVVN